MAVSVINAISETVSERVHGVKVSATAKMVRLIAVTVSSWKKPLRA